MRELKFRAWCKELEEFVDIKEIGIENGEIWYIQPYDDETPAYNPSELEIMQYTGLKDKNGVEIYEGDVYQYSIEINVNDNVSKKYCADVVKYKDGAFWVGEEYLFDAIENDDNPEVIGNIYENPELLEGDSDGPTQ